MMQQTSLEAFYNEILPNLSNRHAQVLKCLRTLGNASNMMIASHLGWSINRVTPRIIELRHFNPPLVVSTGIYPCKITKRKVHYWRCNNGCRAFA